MTQTYGHFCPVARTLEKIGDKWSLLIIRDLLTGPQRFTDLLGYLNHITPKWLTQRLRELESSGIIERDNKPGRRQVWYKLTPAGRDLSPIMDALATWGFRYAMRPPIPGEVVHPDLLMRTLTSSLNKKGKRLPRPAKWLMQFPQTRYSLSFKNDWSSCREEDPASDLKITTTPEIWATVFTAPRSDRSRLAKAIQVEGAPDRIEEFLQTFGIQNQEDKPVPDSVDTVNKRKKPNITKEKKTNLKQAHKGILLAKKLDSIDVQFDFLTLKARAQVLLGDQEGSETCFKHLEEMKLNNYLVPYYLSDYSAVRSLFSISDLEEAVINGDNPRIRQLARESRKWGMQAIKASKKFKRDRVEALRLLGTHFWLTKKFRKALKWWAASVETGERLKMMLDLPRTYFEIGKRLSEPNSPYRELNGISAAEYLGKAKTMFEEMDLQWDLEQLEHLIAGRH